MKKRTVIIVSIISVVVAAAVIGVAAHIFGRGPDKAVNASELTTGEKYLAELDYEKATASLERAITVEPNNTEAYLALAKAYAYMGDADAAKETLEKGFAATNSRLLKQEMENLSSQMTATAPASVSFLGKNVEIAGHVYPSDITELVLRDCGLTDADLQKIAGLTNLERLDISNNEITDISVLAKLTKLRKFYAANNAITDVSVLASLSSLEYIGLRGNQITNADALFGIASLKYLHLSDNQIGSIPAIGENLQLLYLANNKLSGTGTITGTNLLYYDISGNAGR